MITYVGKYPHNIRADIQHRCIFRQDLLSYNKEQATGDDLHNIITVVARERNLNVTGAMNWVQKYHQEAMAKFQEGLKHVPTWGPEVDSQVKQYLEWLSEWPRGHNCWCFESTRYFGNKGAEIQKTRRVPLLPKAAARKDKYKKGGDIVVPDVETIEPIW